MTDSRIETYRFRVEPFHVDMTGHLFLGVLGNHLLNAADHHSDRRGFGVSFLLENHFTWVLSRLSLELTEWPTQYEQVEVETWVESVMKLFTERNFLIRNATDGRIYGYARSIWAMINTDTRHPADLFALHDGAIANYILSASEYPCPIAKHGRVRVSSEEPVRRIPTFYSDVDINGHINSIKYIEHILDLFPRQQFTDHLIRRFEIAYKTESYLGDELTMFCDAVSSSSQEAPAEMLATEHHIEIRKHVGSAEKPAGETVVQAKILWD